MKIKLAMLIGSLFVVSSSLVSQTQPDSLPSNDAYAKLDFGIGSSNYSTSIATHYDWLFGKKRRIVVGSGLRFQTFFGQDVVFTSAPPEFAADVKNQDSLLAPSPFIYSLNGFINLGFRFTPKFMAGFNIDAFGVSFGPNGTPTFVSNGVKQKVKVNPTLMNALLVGANDRGSIKAQLYARYDLTSSWSIHAGIQNLFNELTTEKVWQTVPSKNDRFRAMSNQAFVGVSWRYNG